MQGQREAGHILACCVHWSGWLWLTAGPVASLLAIPDGCNLTVVLSNNTCYFVLDIKFLFIAIYVSNKEPAWLHLRLKSHLIVKTNQAHSCLWLNLLFFKKWAIFISSPNENSQSHFLTLKIGPMCSFCSSFQSPNLNTSPLPNTLFQFVLVEAAGRRTSRHQRCQPASNTPFP